MDDVGEIVAHESVDTFQEVFQSVFDGDFHEYKAILESDVTAENEELYNLCQNAYQ